MVGRDGFEPSTNGLKGSFVLPHGQRLAAIRFQEARSQVLGAAGRDPEFSGGISAAETAIPHTAGMARDRFAPRRRALGPASYCSSCRKTGCGLHAAGSVTVPGIRCYHCGRGRFLHRGAWDFAECPKCDGYTPWCETCAGYGRVPVVNADSARLIALVEDEFARLGEISRRD